MRARETLHKVWSIKDVGSAPWLVDARLVFVVGELAPEFDGRWGCDAQDALVPYAGRRRARFDGHPCAERSGTIPHHLPSAN
jgi:hypothetical protein